MGEELGLTLDEVGSRIGFSKPYLSTIETGKASNPPSDELLQKLEKVIGFEAGTLLYLAHIERLPTDIRERVETAEAENEKWRHLNKDRKRLLRTPPLINHRYRRPACPHHQQGAAGYPTDSTTSIILSASRTIISAARTFTTPTLSRCG